jgi:hypothetical protein
MDRNKLVISGNYLELNGVRISYVRQVKHEAGPGGRHIVTITFDVDDAEFTLRDGIPPQEKVNVEA